SEVSKAIESHVVYRDKSHLGTQPKLYKIPHSKGEVSS
ncbi:4Fe-4S ferredoxin, partial [Vibrio parahaemolyticus]|nr:4Fe-4S ferredoxin [Vibrio parahaemolyticus]